MTDFAKIYLEAENRTKSAFDAVRKDFLGLQSSALSVKNAFVGIGAAVGVAGFGAMIKHSIDAADGLNKLSQKLGITVENLSTLKYAAELADVSSEGFATGLKKLSVNMFDAANGGKETERVFDALKVSIKDGTGNLRTTDAVLLDLAKRFAEMEDGAGKTAIAVKLFGKTGQDMVPLLNAGAEGIREMQEEARQLNLEISTGTAQAAERFNDNMKRVKEASIGLSNALAKELLPRFEDISKAMAQAAKDSGVLTSLWVALGGAAAHVLGITDVDKASDKNIESLTKKLEDRKKRIDELLAKPNKVVLDRLLIEEAQRDVQKLDAELKQAIALRDGFKVDAENRTKAGGKGKPPSLGDDKDDGKLANQSALESARIALARANAEAIEKIFRDSQARELKILDEGFADNIISIKAYYDKKRAIQNADLEAQIDKVRKEIAIEQNAANSRDKESDRIQATARVKQLTAELTILEARRGDINREVGRELTENNRKYQDQLGDIQTRLLQLSGDTVGARTRELEKEFKELTKRLKVESDEAGKAILDELFNKETATVKLQGVQEQIDRILNEGSRAERRVQIEKETGLLTETQSREKLIGIRKKEADDIEALIPKMKELVSITKDKGQEEAIKNLVLQLEELRVVADDVAIQINGALKDGFGDALASLSDDSKKLGDVLKDLVRGFERDLARIAANKASEQIFGAFGKGAGVNGGIGGIFSGVLGGIFGGGGGGAAPYFEYDFANGGVMTSQGPIPLRRYASGGIASSPQIAIFGEGAMNEAYVPLPDGRRIPVAMNQQAGQNITINVNVSGSDINNRNRQSGQQLASDIARELQRSLRRNS